MSQEERLTRGKARQQCRARFPLPRGRFTMCQRCSYAEARERHHIDGNPRNNAQENVLLLCVSCHHAEHSGPRWHADRNPARYPAHHAAA